MGRMKAKYPDFRVGMYDAPTIGYCSPAAWPTIHKVTQTVNADAAKTLCCSKSCRMRAERSQADGISISGLFVDGICMASDCAGFAPSSPAAGLSWLAERGKCGVCPPGTAAPGDGYAHCKACPSGQLSSEDGRTC